MSNAEVTKERIEAVIRELSEGVRSGELKPQEQTSDRGPITPELTGTPQRSAAGVLAGSGGILQLAITPETLLKMTSAGTRELVITVNER